MGYLLNGTWNKRVEVDKGKRRLAWLFNCDETRFVTQMRWLEQMGSKSSLMTSLSLGNRFLRFSPRIWRKFVTFYREILCSIVRSTYFFLSRHFHHNVKIMSIHKWRKGIFCQVGTSTLHVEDVWNQQNGVASMKLLMERGFSSAALRVNIFIFMRLFMRLNEFLCSAKFDEWTFIISQDSNGNVFFPKRGPNSCLFGQLI